MSQVLTDESRPSSLEDPDLNAPWLLADESAESVRPGSRKRLNVAFALGAVFTTFDALASYVWIGVLKVAEEANPGLDALGDSVGFGMAMAARLIVGLTLLTALWKIARGHSKAWRLASRGVTFIAAALGGVAAYHVWGIGYTTWLAVVH